MLHLDTRFQRLIAKVEKTQKKYKLDKITNDAIFQENIIGIKNCNFSESSNSLMLIKSYEKSQPALRRT